MSERFVNFRSEIQKDNHHFAFANSLEDAKKITAELNKMHEENKELHLNCKPLFSKRRLHEENQKLNERNNRQKETIIKQQEEIDSYIDVKAKLNAKIAEFETKAGEYEVGACACGARYNSIKKTALEEFKEEIYKER